VIPELPLLQLGFDPARLTYAIQITTELLNRRSVESASLHLSYLSSSAGLRWKQNQPIPFPDELEPLWYLTASLTKPVVAMGLLKLVEQGQLSLNERVGSYLPQFRTSGRIAMTIRHLLCHTSGLPDLPPDNLELREQHAGLDLFLERAGALPLEFSPGTSCRYSSLGYLVIAKLIEILTATSVPQYLEEEIFKPCGMKDTWLGLPTDRERCQHVLEYLTNIELDSISQQRYGNWNSEYWRGLGSPWGGMISTPADLSKFCQMIYQKGTINQQILFHPQTIHAATSNQLPFYSAISNSDTLSKTWGMGWRRNWVNHRHTFGDFLPESVIGHYGATGCLFWIDLAQQKSLTLCTSVPHDRDPELFVKISNLFCAAWQC
jgi:CubicO group peptidase (beta-lactamase class C family)